MLNLQDFKNASITEEKIILLVDDVNNSHSYGFTKSLEKVTYNLDLLKDYLDKDELDRSLAKSKEGLTSLFPIGRYISILKIKNDKSIMMMYFFDFRKIAYQAVDHVFKDTFSENVITQFKSIKYHMEEIFNDDMDCVLIDSTLEPPTNGL